jgi:signal transduction histidine kinase/CheY-like chemotaxis protein
MRAEAQRLTTLNRIGTAIAAELDLERIVQLVVDACTELTGAGFGAFFYNVADDEGERYTLYSLSGAPRSAFAGFPMPRTTAVFQPTFRGEAIVRSDDILADPRYGRNAPHNGMPKGHLPVRSYLAVPVTSRSGEVIGGLFFGHSETGRFTAVHADIVAGVAGQAATAIDNARLFAAAERELAERRRAEAALQALNETLESRVVDAIAERLEAEAALRQSQKTEVLGQLTGGVAHDFNNLLQVISGNLQLLAREVAGNARAESRIEQALAAVGQGAKLASQLLAFGRRQPLEPKVVNLGRMVAGMAELLRRTIGEGIEVRTIVSGELWNTLVDPAQLETAILNLALNARDAMGEAGTLTIEVGNAVLGPPLGNGDVAPGEYVVVAVGDTGSGIPRELMDRVFDPFFTTKPQGKGTGLGLSMVYGFVTQSGGQVRIESEAGSGTTVKVYLPRVDRSEDRPAERADGPVTGGTETILVVEDDARVRETVVGLLSDLGYRVLPAPDAARALELLESGAAIDLLFTDVVMPGKLRGPELARLARERVPGIAVLFTSGYAEDAIVHDGRLDAGVELISKPYAREALARKVRQVLCKAGREPRPAGPLQGLTVVLCEDDALIRMNAADVLSEAGAEVIEAGTGAAALALFTERAVDVLVIDVGLPDLSGVEVAERVRQSWPEAAILFATGHLGVPGTEGLERTAILQKPYGEDELCGGVARLVGRAP